MLARHLRLHVVPEERTTGELVTELEASGWSQGLVDWYGSEALALEAFGRSQANRHAAIARSKVPTTVVDTSARDWERIVEVVVDACIR